MTGHQRQQLQNALLDAFPTYDQLRSLVLFGMDKSLHEISRAEDLNHVVFELLRWTEAHDRSKELLVAALNQYAGNLALRSLAEEMDLAPSIPSITDLESILQRPAGPEDIILWRRRLAAIEPAICRVEAINANHLILPATGFLVSPDLIMTSHHVVAQIGDMVLRFDHRVGVQGLMNENSGQAYSLIPDPVFVSPNGYALLRVKGTPGHDPVGGQTGAPPRGWLTPVSHFFVQPETVLLLQQLEGRSLQLAFGIDPAAENLDRSILPRVSTAPGSVGSPCFNKEWNLVGMLTTQMQEPAEVVLFGAILEELKEKDLRGLLGGSTQTEKPVHWNRATVAERIQKLRHPLEVPTAVPKLDEEREALLQRYEAAAALRITFDPETLAPWPETASDPEVETPEVRRRALESLLANSTISHDHQGNVRWMLRTPVRRQALQRLLSQSPIKNVEPHISERLAAVKVELGWINTTGSARNWWEAFERENQHRLALVLRLAEELRNRNATITEFFLAYVYSNTDNIQANLHYLDYTRLKKEEEKKKKGAETNEVFASLWPEEYDSSSEPIGITNTKGWTDERIRPRIEEAKMHLDWDNTTGPARKWWEALEQENMHRLDLVLRLAEELTKRNTTITEFFLANEYSNTDNVQANLHYLDYTRLKKEEERKKKGTVRDPLQRIFTAYLFGTAPDVEKQSIEELSSTLQVIDWLSGVNAFPQERLPSADTVRSRLARENLFKPFRYLVGEHFRGRQKELQQLREYVGVLPSQTLAAGLRRRVREILSLHENPPLVIWGPGGMGKSTLVARFILEHTDYVSEPQEFPFVYLDFDRPGLTAEEPITLLLEAIRQLEDQYPAIRLIGRKMRRCWQRRYTYRQTPRNPQVSMSEENLEAQSTLSLTSLPPDAAEDLTRSALPATDQRRFLKMFRALFQRIPGTEDCPLLLVLDTFEEVQYRSRDFVRALWQLLDNLQAEIPRLRTVLSGRAPVTIEGYKTNNLELDTLDREAAQGYLMHLGITDPKLSEALVKQLSGNPLSLKLAADIARREGIGTEGITDLKTRRFLWVNVGENLIQGQLYRRILGHIHDEEVRKLAHPGLVLRRITPQLIRDVLAEPCGVNIQDENHAHRLFEELEHEVSLVTVASDGALEHRTDVRRVMLNLLRHDEPLKVRQIHEAAVRFYARQTESLERTSLQALETRGEDIAPFVVGRAQEIYHRLCLGEDSPSIDTRWLPGVESYLRGVLEELPPQAQAYLASHIGVDLDPAIWGQANQEDWERHVDRRVRDLMRLGEDAEALRALREREDRVPGSPLHLLEVLVLERLGRLDEARHAAEEGIASVAYVGDRTLLSDLFIAGARLNQRQGNFAAAEDLLEEAQKLLRKPDGTPPDPTNPNAMRFLEIGTQRLALSLPPEHDRQPLRAELYLLASKLPEEVIRQLPEAYCRLVGLLGMDYPEMIIHTVQIGGLGWIADHLEQRTALGHALALWDVMLARDRDVEPGDVLRPDSGIGYSSGGEILQDWWRWAERQTLANIGNVLARHLNNFPPTTSILCVVSAALRGERADMWKDYRLLMDRMIEVPSLETTAKNSIPNKDKTDRQEIISVPQEIALAQRQIYALATLYDHLRDCIPAGDARTVIMAIVVANMRLMAPIARHIVPNLARSASTGRRLAATAILQAVPRRDYLSWLAQRLNAESAFFGYQAGQALKSAANELRGNEEAAAEVSAAIADARRRLGTNSDTPGRTQILEEAQGLLGIIPR